MKRIDRLQSFYSNLNVDKNLSVNEIEDMFKEQSGKSINLFDEEVNKLQSYTNKTIQLDKEAKQLATSIIAGLDENQIRTLFSAIDKEESVNLIRYIGAENPNNLLEVPKDVLNDVVAVAMEMESRKDLSMNTYRYEATNDITNAILDAYVDDADMRNAMQIARGFCESNMDIVESERNKSIRTRVIGDSEFCGKNYLISYTDNTAIEYKQMVESGIRSDICKDIDYKAYTITEWGMTSFSEEYLDFLKEKSDSISNRTIDGIVPEGANLIIDAVHDMGKEIDSKSYIQTMKYLTNNLSYDSSEVDAGVVEATSYVKSLCNVAEKYYPENEKMLDNIRSAIEDLGDSIEAIKEREFSTDRDVGDDFEI